MKFKEGDKVKIIYKEGKKLTDQLVYPYMEGMTGRVANVYNKDEIAVEVDIASLPKVAGEVHRDGTKRLRAKFADSVGEEARKKMTDEELNFTPHYVALIAEDDLVSI